VVDGVLGLAPSFVRSVRFRGFGYQFAKWYAGEGLGVVGFMC